MSRPCACRRELTESELFAAHGVGRAPIVEHDAPEHGVPVLEQRPALAQLVRERYAARDVVLTRLAATERRLTVGGRS